MADRALISLLPAVAGGFTCGVIAAVLQFNDPAAMWLGIAVGAAVVVCGLLSVAGAGRAGVGERAIVAVLRALCSLACFWALYAGVIAFLRDGQVGAAFALWVAAAVFGALTARIRLRVAPPPTTA